MTLRNYDYSNYYPTTLVIYRHQKKIRGQLEQGCYSKIINRRRILRGWTTSDFTLETVAVTYCSMVLCFSPEMLQYYTRLSRKHGSLYLIVCSLPSMVTDQPVGESEELSLGHSCVHVTSTSTILWYIAWISCFTNCPALQAITAETTTWHFTPCVSSTCIYIQRATDTRLSNNALCIQVISEIKC